MMQASSNAGVARPSVCAVFHRSDEFARRSGLFPLVEALGVQPVYYDETWRTLQKRCWTAGQALRRWGNLYYGSMWNALIPYWSERAIRRQMPADLDIAHFLWGEFAGPRHRGAIHRKAQSVVGTFHATARRLPTVLSGFRGLAAYDWITLMSESQRPYFESLGFPFDRLRVILHGIDTEYFCPLLVRRRILDNRSEASWWVARNVTMRSWLRF